MNLDVNYSKLKTISTKVDEKYESIERVFDEILSLIDDMETAWGGNDAMVFQAKIRHYVEKEKVDNLRINDVAVILQKVSGRYETNDKEFYDRMKKESVIDEQKA